MIWLTWRQVRASVVVAVAAVAVLATILILTGPALSDDLSALEAECRAEPFSCQALGQQFFHAHRSSFLAVSALVLACPALVGLFWGAPLITREAEAGTHLLAWSQSVTRSRWLAVKLVLVGVAAVTVTGLVTLAVTWWSSPIDQAGVADFPRMAPLLFPARGITPMAYAAFAFTLGVVVGLLVRRTLPALAITLVVYVAVQVLMPVVVRPHLISPEQTTIEISHGNSADYEVHRVGPDRVRFDAGDTGDWILVSRTVDASGHPVDAIDVSRFPVPCDPPLDASERAESIRDPAECFFTETARLGYRQEVTYHPADRFWRFQWIETGLYAVLALGLAGAGLWRIRRDLP